MNTTDIFRARFLAFLFALAFFAFGDSPAGLKNVGGEAFAYGPGSCADDETWDPENEQCVMTVTGSNFGSGSGNTGTGNNTGGGYSGSSGSSSGGHSGRPGGGSSATASFTNRDCWVGGAGHGTCPPNRDTSSDDDTNSNDESRPTDRYDRPSLEEVVESLAADAVKPPPAGPTGMLFEQGTTAALRPPTEHPCDNAEFRRLFPDTCTGFNNGPNH